LRGLDFNVEKDKLGGIIFKKNLRKTPSGKAKDQINYLIELYEPDFILESFKFTFVRHPLDRFLSAYLSMSSNFGNPDISFLGSYLNDKWDGKEDLWVTGRGGLSIDEKIYRFNKFCSLFVFPCADLHFSNYFFNLPKDLNQLDFVGKLESADNDFKFTVNKILCGREKDVEDAFKIYKDTIVIHSDHDSRHKRKNLNYREFYSDENYKLVASNFKKEMDMFDYE
jgi:hypothetical protein